MPLPFILGLAVGAGAVIAFKNKDTLKEKKGIIYHLPQIARNTIPHANLIGASLLNGA